MSRRSSIETHPQREAIEKALATGVTGAQIARQYGVSESAISRHRISRMDVLAQVAALDTPDPTSVITRLMELADDARSTRKLAALSGTPVTRARAQSAELAALEKLADRLGIDDTTVIQIAGATGALVRAVQKYVRTNPDRLADVLAILREHEELHELADTLQAQTGR
jgi:transposase-like protein